jgi:Tfp pilus assembly protein PilF
MRAQALANSDVVGRGGAAEAGGFEAMLNMAYDSGSSSLLAIAGALGGSLKVIAWPYPLHLVYASPSIPLSIVYAALHLFLISVAAIQYRRNHYGLAVGMAFFYIAMLPASQILSPGSATAHIAERYLYFPSVGLAILLAFAARALVLRFGTRIVAALAMPVVLFLTALTLDRNADWANEIALFGTEYERGKRNGFNLRLVTSAYMGVKDYARVVELCDENLSVQKKDGGSSFVENCAFAYESQQRLAEAERAHRFAIRFRSTRVASSMSLARFYIRHGRPEDAAKEFSAAIDWSHDPAAKALYSAEMIMSLYPGNRERWIEAKGLLEEALDLKPGWPQAESLLKAVNSELNSIPESAKRPEGF